MGIRPRFTTPWIILVSLIVFFDGNNILQTSNHRNNFTVFISSNVMQPHILLFITDDQDDFLDGMTPMTKTKSWFENGQEFTNAFISTPIGCQSRSSIITGKYQHNTTQKL